MRRILKFKLNETLPITSIADGIREPLWVDYQNGVPYLWAVCDDEEANKCACEIYRIGTGQPIDDSIYFEAYYINTTVAQSAPYVWHWFYHVVPIS